MNPCEVQIFCSVKGGSMALERRLRVGELVLRLAVLGLGVTAAALIGSDSEVKWFFSFEKKARFTDMKVLVFLVVANGAAAGNSLLQGVYCVVRMMKGSLVFKKGLAWVVFGSDQVMAYVTLSAIAAALEASVLGKYGQAELQWMKSCSFYRHFCTQVEVGLICAFIASFVMIILSFLSAFNLFRLYGTKKLRHSTNGSL